MSELCFTPSSALQSLVPQTQGLCFSESTRFFELIVDPYADDFSLFAFSSLLRKQIRHQVAVNGEFNDPQILFEQLFIWKFTSIKEVTKPDPLEPSEWLLVQAEARGV